MPLGINIGPLFVRFYGIIIMLGAVVAAVIAAALAKRKGENPEVIWDSMPWVLIGGIIGARLWHIFTPNPSLVAQGVTTMYYLTHPLDAIAIWRGGVGIPGAVIGGALALYIYTRKNKLNFLLWVDFIAPGLAFAQAAGRWGNFINREVYGAPTDLPWKIYIEPEYRLPQYINQEYYHPLFLYESLWNLFNMAFLIWLGKKFEKRLLPGDVFLVYLIIYPVGRFFLEFLRLDSSQVAGVNANQTFVAIVAVISAVMLFLRHRKKLTENTDQPENQDTVSSEK